MIRRVMPWLAAGPGDLTILRAPGRRLAKLITPDGIVDYDRTLRFEVDAVRLEGFDDLHEFVERQADQPDSCVIRGVVKPEFAARREVLRRLRDSPSARPGHVIHAPFVPADRCWAMLDVEGLPIPPGVDPCDPVLAGGAARLALPAPFRSARAVVQLSSKAGLVPEIRVHLLFWLSRAVSDADLKRWLAHTPVDCALFNAIQVHYIATPLFKDRDDPVLERLALLPGLAEVAVGDLPAPVIRRAFTVAAEAAYVAPARGLGFRSTRAEKYMLACLRGVAAADPGNRHPTIVRVAARLYGLAKAGLLDPADVERRVLGAVALSTFDRGEDEVRAALLWAWEHSTPWRLP